MTPSYTCGRQTVVEIYEKLRQTGDNLYFLVDKHQYFSAHLRSYEQHLQTCQYHDSDILGDTWDELYT